MRPHNWKGGRCLDKAGYVRVLCKGHPKATPTGYVYEHRLVMERHLGRFLGESEVVHHRNHDKTDNRLENLELTTHGDHQAIHHAGVLERRTREQEQTILNLRAEGKLVSEITAVVGLCTPTVVAVLDRAPVVCGLCGRRFERQKALGMHLTRSHRS